METLQQIIAAILKNKGSKAPAMTASTSLRKDLGFDSFDLAELTVHVEEKFGIDVFEDGLIETLGELCSKLNIK